jgi:hypothetical protein
LIIPTFTTGPFAAADVVDPDAALTGTAIAAMAAIDTTSSARRA